MSGKAHHPHAFPAAAVFAALAALVPAPAGAAEVACQASDGYLVEVDGKFPSDARFFETDANGVYFVDLPSEKKGLLIDVQAGRAIPLERSSVRIDPVDGTLRVPDRGPRGGPDYSLAIEGTGLSIQTDTSRVRVLAIGSPSAGRPGTKPPADGAVAKDCLRLEARPVTGVTGCMKFAFLRNSCDAPVVASVQRTEHLFSGRNTQAARHVVPALGAESLGCFWWSGAMAPTDLEVISAAFVGAPPAQEVRKR
jgi:hypothetical protein